MSRNPAPGPHLYVVAFTGRSGSSYLCDHLRSTGCLGAPEEYCNPGTIEGWKKALGARSHEELLPLVLKKTATENGVAGLKITWGDLEILMKHIDLPGEFRTARYIWLRRRDRLRQAISWYRARCSGVWHWWPGDVRRDNGCPFDAERIFRCVRQIVADEEGWRRWFDGSRIVPLELWYEDIVGAERATVRRICDFLDVPGDALPETVARVRMQRDELTEAWVRRINELHPDGISTAD